MIYVFEITSVFIMVIHKNSYYIIHKSSDYKGAQGN